MMMQRNYQIKPIVRFRYWSRKNYAMFISLGCQVTIGCLTKGVLEVALRKQESGMAQTTGGQFQREEIPLEEDSETLSKPLHQWLLIVEPQIVARGLDCDAKELKLIDNYVSRRHTD